MNNPVLMRFRHERLLDEISEPMTTNGKRAIRQIYNPKKLEQLKGKWVGYHLLEYATKIRNINSDTRERLDKALIDIAGINNFTTIQNIPSATGTSPERTKKIFRSLAEAENKSLLICFVEFLEHCKRKKWPLITFDTNVQSDDFNPKNVEYTTLNLKKIIFDIRSYIDPLIKSPYLSLKTPYY